MSRPRRASAPPLSRAWVLLGLLLLILPVGSASARTTVTHFAASHLAIHAGGKPVPPTGVTVGTTVVVHFTILSPGRTTVAGRQAISLPGVSGRTSTLPVCTVSPCTDLYRGAGAARLRTGDYGVLAHLTVTQPPVATGTAVGFSFELAIKTTAGWTVTRGYLSTGTTTAATSRTIDVDFYIDLGVRTLPTLLVTDVVLDACAGAANCP